MTDDPRYHYAVMARAIAALDSAQGPLPLAALSAQLGMSEAHFQRLFSAWVGVSPKRYQQYLALGLAKERLAQEGVAPEGLARERGVRATGLLDAADAAGLSGPSRLHDLFLRWEGMTPGAYAKGGAGLVLRWCSVDTPYGAAVAVAGPRGLCALSFVTDTAEDTLAALAPRWPQARLEPDSGMLRPAVEAMIAGKGGLPLTPAGGPFQIKVWQALLDIPPGAVTTYAAIAARIGRPAAHRAVATAIGQNPLGLLIPCHRVIRRDGGLGGYAWGLTRKRAMLAREAARQDGATE